MEASTTRNRSEVDRLVARRPTSEVLADFTVAVCPFQRVVYLVALACTRHAALAEIVSVDVMASAFNQWNDQPVSLDQIQSELIRRTISEACARADCLADCPEEEDIETLLSNRRLHKWLPISLDAVRSASLRTCLSEALHEVQALSAVALILHDTFHLTTRQISDLIGESHVGIKARLAYARIAACVKLAERLPDPENAYRLPLAEEY